MTTSKSRPIVGIPADFRLLDQHPFHCIGHKYVRAVTAGADALALLIPALGVDSDPEEILAAVDGILFTGSPSNVEPIHYGATLSAEHLADKRDPMRDATTLPLIRAAIAAGVPIIGICRGFQEINVACGGSLHQEVHKVAGMADHRDPDGIPLDQAYGPAHPIALTPGGLLARLAGSTVAQVNSLHGQGVDRLGAGLVVEARAPDGLIEAYTVDHAPGFTLALQWHPEWKFEDNAFSKAIFAEFGRACRQRQSARTGRTVYPAGTTSDSRSGKILEQT